MHVIFSTCGVCIIDLHVPVFSRKKIPFFQNGCFANKGERLSEDNYSCAVDSFIAMGESILLCGNYKSIDHCIGFSPILQEIMAIVVWRLKNHFSWNHPL